MILWLISDFIFIFFPFSLFRLLSPFFSCSRSVLSPLSSAVRSSSAVCETYQDIYEQNEKDNAIVNNPLKREYEWVNKCIQSIKSHLLILLG